MNIKCARFIRQVDGSIVLPVAICLFFAALLLPMDASALDSVSLPTGGVITSGSGSISSSEASMTVQQDSLRMIVDWESFNIGKDAEVTFMQPGRSAAALNRIHDQNPSEIMGKLSANGQVFLVNSSGIVFGSSSQVNVGGLVASSLDIDDADFMEGNNSFQSDGNAGAVSNAGSIDAEGGYVALIAPVVENSGSISADDGTVVMAAGNRVTLDLTGDDLVTFTIDQGAVDAQAANHGIIQADGGLVYLSAEAANELTRAAVNNDGIIRAQTLRETEGKIMLMADMESGTVEVGGTLDASAPDGGDGGFIETSAATVNIVDDFTVTTAAATGETGTWLIDPTDFTIAESGGDMTGSQVEAAIASTDLTIQSTDSSTGTDGNIYVNDTISWSSNTLTLSAYNNIEINSEMTVSGEAGLALEYGQGATNGSFDSGITYASYSVNAPINLGSECSFSTKLGSTGSPISYTIITELGSAGSTTGSDLQGISGNLSGNYVLGSDIDASATSGWSSGSGFDPIGDDTGRFTGTFDGLGHTVSNLAISSSSNYTGLFGWVFGATIRNIGITGGSIKGTASHTGGLVGFLYYSTISNSYVTADVEGNYGTGGLVGRSEGSTITECYATGNVTGGNSTGGLVGIANQDTITDSYASGKVKGVANVGGLVGIADDSDISDSYFTGDAGGSVTGTSGSHTGGLVGRLNSSTISNSYVTADVTGYYCTGGLVAYLSGSTVSQSYATGDVSGTGTVGGFAGIIEDSEVTESYAGGNVTGSSTVVGGFAGYLSASSSSTKSTITDSYATGDVDGFRSVGGLVGLMGNRINKKKPDSDITGGSSTITNSYATGDVTGEDNFVGGLVGYSGALILDDSDDLGISSTSCTISNSYATGAVEGIDYLGGLVGYSGAYIGTGSGKASITNISSTIENSYAGGAAKGKGSNVGAFLGYSGDVVDGTCSDSSSISGISSEVKDKDGKSVTEFTSFVLKSEQKNLKFYSTLGWNIDDEGGTGTIWRIYEGNTYPLLRYFLTQAGATAVNKVYDGTTSLDSASISWSSGTDETLIYGTASSSGSEINAGSYSMTLSGLYSSQQGYDILADANLTITPASLTVTTSDVTKTYDGATTANGTATVTSGKLYGTDAISGGTFFFTDANAGSGKTVTVNDVSIADGNSGNNYTVTYVDNTSSTITPASLTVTTSDVTKTYDGTTTANGTATVTSGTLYGTDAISGGTFFFTDANAGSGKTVTINDVSIADGNSGNNYTVTYVDNTSSTITPASLTVTARDYSKYYDGTAYSGGNGVTYSGFVNGEAENVLSGVLTYSGTSQGATDTGTYVITASGFASDNYNISFVDGELIVLPPAIDPGMEEEQPDDDKKKNPLYPRENTTALDKVDSGSLLDVDKAIVENGEMTILATESSLLAIDFEYSSGGTVTLFCGGAAKNELRSVIDALPVFLDEGGSRSFAGNYAVQESPGTVSLKRLGEGRSYEDISANVQEIRGKLPFNLTVGDDKSAEFTVGVTENGAIFVSRSDGDIMSLIDREQIVLIALQIIKQDMGVDLKNIRGVVIVTEGGFKEASAN